MMAEHGYDDDPPSWELDALEPSVIDGLIREAIAELLDLEIWDRDLAAETANNERLASVGNNWDDVSRYLEYRNVELDIVDTVSADDILNQAEEESK